MINLAGEWDYKIDVADEGFASKWYASDFLEKGFMIPGSVTEHLIGEEYEYDGKLTEGNVRHLRQKFKYIGKIWLKKIFSIDDIYESSYYELVLERVMWQSEVWLNGCYVGKRDSLSTAHRYNLTDFIKENNELVLCIDNRDIHQINDTPSAYTEETQSIWCGIVGACEILETKARFNELSISADSHKKAIVIDYAYNILESEKDCVFEVTILHDGNHISNKKVPLINHSGSQRQVIELDDIKLWDEFTPELYEVIGKIKRKDTVLVKEQRMVGFRSWGNDPGQLTLNDNPTFLRGTIDCCIFPLTGYPPVDEVSWEEIFGEIKSYGLNHVRFHTWCPPEAAFSVADKLGLYLQVEAPIWLDDWMPFMLGDKVEHASFFLSESTQIVKDYGHHPSFCIFSCGNEIRGDFDILRTIVQELRLLNNYILYTFTSNWDRQIDKEEDLFIAQTVDQFPVRGQYHLDTLVEETTLNYSQAVSLRNVPVISHEVGQYSIYPAIDEIPNYSGNLLPINFQAIKEDLQKKDMIQYAQQFTYASGRLAYELYKDEIEASLRTPKMGGYQLLGLNDFTGQSTATVGLLDSFWKSKGITTKIEYTQFSNCIVPLALMEQRIVSSKQKLPIEIKIANYYASIPDVKIEWLLKNNDQCIQSDIIELEMLELGLQTVDHLVLSFESVITASQLVLSIRVITEHQKFENSWKIWCYPEASQVDGVIESDRVNDDLLEEVYNGSSLFLHPPKDLIKSSEKTTFFPVFWSPVHFKSKDNCGLLVNNEHPIFNLFPSDNYGNYQWKPLIESGFSVPFENFGSEFQPVVQIVPNFFNNSKRFMLAEWRYGKGRILFSSLNLNNDSLPATTMKTAIKEYMLSKAFNPIASLDKEQIESIFVSEKNQPQLINLSQKGKCSADSTLNSIYAPENALLRDSSAWKPKDNLPGHWWKIDLGEIKKVSEIKIHLLSQGTYYFNINASIDGQHFNKLISKTIDTKKSTIISDEVNTEARFIQIVYGDVSVGVEIGHERVEVLGMAIDHK